MFTTCRTATAASTDRQTARVRYAVLPPNCIITLRGCQNNAIRPTRLMCKTLSVVETEKSAPGAGAAVARPR
ncbi:hypothetical protein EVAR_26430_1 [Eumeta japonica]|uniref:Uncharacterized protein n=1 Tax=Eumeta variegata TaxID=151549 RepID=A0A4C1VNR9_EUMVA|nr:hypothetical protein EVAR_26430_1 [Eumeta japonica]